MVARCCEFRRGVTAAQPNKYGFVRFLVPLLYGWFCVPTTTAGSFQPFYWNGLGVVSSSFLEPRRDGVRRLKYHVDLGFGVFRDGTDLPTDTNNNSIDNNHDEINHPGAKNNNTNSIPKMIRLNKVFRATHSRRQADALIATLGLVTVNGRPVQESGCMVQPYQDVVHLNGELVQGWELLNNAVIPTAGSSLPTKTIGESYHGHENEYTVFEYVKYWKPQGVICTTDRRVAGNILDAMNKVGYHSTNRVFPVGRLDKDTSGLILLTSDGRLPNALLRKGINDSDGDDRRNYNSNRRRHPKVYNVQTDRPLQEQDLEQLRVGRCSVAVCMVCIKSSFVGRVRVCVFLAF
jgi:16S rRNA U516 pseudouridylate synthase RsuA-like enzyme